MRARKTLHEAACRVWVAWRRIIPLGTFRTPREVSSLYLFDSTASCME